MQAAATLRKKPYLQRVKLIPFSTIFFLKPTEKEDLDRVGHVTVILQAKADERKKHHFFHKHGATYTKRSQREAIQTIAVSKANEIQQNVDTSMGLAPKRAAAVLGFAY